MEISFQISASSEQSFCSRKGSLLLLLMRCCHDFCCCCCCRRRHRRLDVANVVVIRKLHNLFAACRRANNEATAAAANMSQSCSCEFVRCLYLLWSTCSGNTTVYLRKSRPTDRPSLQSAGRRASKQAGWESAEDCCLCSTRFPQAAQHIPDEDTYT